MKPQTGAFLIAADRALSDARVVFTANLPHQAARLAYYAEFHSAQALIFERTGKIAKTHKGVGNQFHLLARAESSFPVGIAAELVSAYRFKEFADYDTIQATPITAAIATGAIATAERFVAAVRQALASPTSAP